MSPVDRPMSGELLRFSLDEERARVNDRAILESHGRNARTLLKERHLRLTLITVRAGSSIAKHHSAGPITVQVLEGDIRFRAAGKEHLLKTGDLLALGAGIEHDVATDGGGTFLLTLVQPA